MTLLHFAMADSREAHMVGLSIPFSSEATANREGRVGPQKLAALLQVCRTHAGASVQVRESAPQADPPLPAASALRLAHPRALTHARASCEHASLLATPHIHPCLSHSVTVSPPCLPSLSPTCRCVLVGVLTAQRSRMLHLSLTRDRPVGTAALSPSLGQPHIHVASASLAAPPRSSACGD